MKNRNAESITPAQWVTASAYVFALSYYSARFAPLAWVGLLPLLAVLRRATPRTAAAWGLLWGLIFSSLLCVVRPFADLGHCASFVLFGAVGVSLLALGTNRLSLRLSFSPIAVGLAWFLFEIVRNILFPDSPALPGSHDLSTAAGNVAAFAGLAGLLFLVVAVNVSLIRLWDQIHVRSRRSGMGLRGTPPPLPVPTVLLRSDASVPAFPQGRAPPIQ